MEPVAEAAKAGLARKADTVVAGRDAALLPGWKGMEAEGQRMLAGKALGAVIADPARSLRLNRWRGSLLRVAGSVEYVGGRRAGEYLLGWRRTRLKVPEDCRGLIEGDDYDRGLKMLESHQMECDFVDRSVDMRAAAGAMEVLESRTRKVEDHSGVEVALEKAERLYCLDPGYNIALDHAELEHSAVDSRSRSRFDADFDGHMIDALVATWMHLVETHSLGVP